MIDILFAVLLFLVCLGLATAFALLVVLLIESVFKK